MDVDDADGAAVLDDEECGDAEALASSSAALAKRSGVDGLRRAVMISPVHLPRSPSPM